ncbi:MAG: hypothetical protein V4458_00805 [Pseudomonadota bacterium]|nr:hypothetical protein [Afipia sp.]
MLILPILAAATGLVFGFAQFRAVVLLPALFGVLAVVAWLGYGAAWDWSSMVRLASFSLFGMQCGYFAGVCGAYFKSNGIAKSKAAVIKVSRFG